MDISEILGFNLISIGSYTLEVYQILLLLFLFIAARYGTRFILKGMRKLIKPSVDQGRVYALEKFVRYLIYVVAFFLASQSLGIDLSIIMAGSAALMVGIGFGLQQTANDFISGIIILVDGSVEKGDTLTVGNEIGVINAIGIRASEMRTFDNRVIIIPNSKLVNDNVINWNHNNDLVRFHVSVGVAYGTDTELVRELLERVALEEDKVLNHPKPFVRFVNFGDSSLDFELHCYFSTIEVFEDVKSTLRFRINHIFREYNIEIPFPQRDVWFKNSNDNRQDSQSNNPFEELIVKQS